jgi:signal transduction histidine kinase
MRLALWYALLMSITLAAFIAFVYLQVRDALYTSVDNGLAARAAQLAAATTVNGSQVQIQATSISQAQGATWAYVFSAHGDLLDRAGPSPGPSPDHRAVLRALGGWTGWVSVAGNLRVYTSREHDDTGQLFVVQVIGSRAGADRTVTRVLVAIGLGAPILLLCSGAGGVFLAGRALKPVDAITRTARRLGTGDFHERLGPPAREDEVGRLARTFDWMLDRLEETFRRQRQFTADASHELRTPLTILQGEVDLALARPRRPEEYVVTLQIVQDQIVRMQGLVEDLLTLARADNERADVARDVILLDELVRQAARQSQALFAAKGLVLDVAVGGDGCPVIGDDGRLTQMVLNLLSNAARYTDRGGVSIAVRREAQQAVLTVRDTGIGIPPDRLALIFERFYRVDIARTRAEGGTGLGLAIAAWIAQAHGGRLTVDSVVGEGSTFRFTMPLAPTEALRD